MLSKVTTMARLWVDAHMSRDQLRRMQESKLRRLVRHAAAKVPYYRQLFRIAGVHAEEIRRVGDLERIPLSTKRELRDAGLERTVARGVDLSACQRCLTSGSTGEPFLIHRSHGETLRRQLLYFRGLLQAGMRPLDRLATLGPRSNLPRPMHERLGLFQTTFVPTTVDLDDQIRLLKRASPTILWAYPTLLNEVYRQVGSLGQLIQPRLLLTSSESLGPRLRDSVAADLGAEVLDMYGAVEVGRIAVECRTHQGLHVAADQLLLEIVDANADGVGVVVVTDLENLTQPLLRYRLGDLSVLRTRPCDCGSSFPLISPPLGRHEETLRLPDGARVTWLPLARRIKEFLEIEQYRFVQRRVDHIVLQVALRQSLSDGRREQLLAAVTDMLGPQVHVDLQLVKALPPIGLKTIRVVSEMADTERA